MSEIHPSAIIEPGAQIAEGAYVGPYAFIGGQVCLGAGSRVEHHATVAGNTVLGRDNIVHPYAYIGGPTHDLKFKGGNPGLRVGDRNVFREYVTVHCATADGDFTILGSDNVILAYSHIAHDCKVGDHFVMSSHAALAGHVVVGDHVNFGWGAGIHQFCRIGDYAMVAGMARVSQDVPPFVIVEGSPAVSRMINKVGLERNGLSAAEIQIVRRIFKIYFREGLNRSQARERISAEGIGGHPLGQRFMEFVTQSERGIC